MSIQTGFNLEVVGLEGTSAVLKLVVTPRVDKVISIQNSVL